MRISDWISDVGASDLDRLHAVALRGATLLAPAAAAGVRHVRGGGGAGLLRRPRQRPAGAWLRGLPAALLAAAPVAAGHVHRRRVRHHLEPPVVPGLPVALHDAAGSAAAAAQAADCAVAGGSALADLAAAVATKIGRAHV